MSPAPSANLWFWLAAGVIAAYLVHLLRPILTPFAVAALLAYLGDPVVDRLERHRFSRSGAVVTVFVGIFAGGLVLVALLVPLLEAQAAALLRQIPRYLEWLQSHVLGPLLATFELEPSAFGIDSLKRVAVEHWSRAGGIAMSVVGDISRSGAAVLGWIANLVLVPVVTFYLLRDWDRLVASVHDLLPRTVAPRAGVIAGECDAVLGEFFRGQLLVMLILAGVYAAGLWLVGLELALLIGLTAGLVSFVPYLGVIVGVALALAAAYFQFGVGIPMVWVAVVFGAGQVLEGFLLTPWLVGDRIGLHPVAVIFAVLAGGQLFGFFGVLLALPVAAVVVVLLRHARDEYVDSDLYREPLAATDGAPPRAGGGED